MCLARPLPLLGDLVEDDVQLPTCNRLSDVAEGRHPGEDDARRAHVALDLLKQSQRPVHQLRGLGDLCRSDGAHRELVHDVVDVVERVEGACLPAPGALDHGVEGCRGVGGEEPEVAHEVLLLHQLGDGPAEPLAELTGLPRIVLLSNLGRGGKHHGISVPAGGLLVSTKAAQEDSLPSFFRTSGNSPLRHVQVLGVEESLTSFDSRYSNKLVLAKIEAEIARVGASDGVLIEVAPAGEESKGSEEGIALLDLLGGSLGEGRLPLYLYEDGKDGQQEDVDAGRPILV